MNTRWVAVQVAFFSIVIIFSSMFTGSMEIGKTAMENRPIADAMASEWSGNASLIYVWVNHDLDTRTPNRSIFTYAENAQSISQGSFRTFTLYFHNGTAMESSTNRDFMNSTNKVIDRWNIDSDELWGILDSNETFKQFVRETRSGGGPRWETRGRYASFILEWHKGEPNPVWRCIFFKSYYSWGVFDSVSKTVHCEARIDAFTGEILEIYWIGKSPSSLMCYTCLASPAAIVALMYLIIRRRRLKRTESPDTVKEKGANEAEEHQKP